jgi:L,D-transpeptidase catalytic domain
MAAPKLDKTKKIVVNLDRQVVVLYQSGEAILVFDCVSGDDDHPTPEGHFRILRKVNPCFSNDLRCQWITPFSPSGTCSWYMLISEICRV